jgi:copper homeostasis protein
MCCWLMESSLFVCLAIDVTCNILQELAVVLSLGCERVLTSGGELTALEGAPTIRKMIEHTDNRIIVVPGAF